MWCLGSDELFLFCLCALVIVRPVYYAYRMLKYDHVRVNTPQERNRAAPAYVQQRIREFWVTSEEGERRVLDFYEWLDSPSVVPDNSASDKYNLHNAVRLSSYQVRKMLTGLYEDSCMWYKLDVPDHPEYTFAQLWLHLMETTFAKHISRFFATYDTAKSKHARVKLATKLMRDLIVFSKLLTHPECTFSDNKFTRSVYKKILELSAANGLLPAFLAFGHLQPELVCEDCYPVLNNDTVIYQELVVLEELEEDDVFGPLVHQFEEYVIL